MPLIQWIMQNLFGSGPKAALTGDSSLQASATNLVNAQADLSSVSTVFADPSFIQIDASADLHAQSTTSFSGTVILAPRDFVGGMADYGPGFPTDFAF